MDVYDFISGGGLYRTESGYDANVTSVLVKSGNTYPLLGYVLFTPYYTANVAWTANGTAQFISANNASLNLVPVFTITNYASGDPDSLSSYSNTATWNTGHNIVYHDRVINYNQ